MYIYILCVYIYTYVYKYVYLYIHTCIQICIYIYICAVYHLLPHSFLPKCGSTESSLWVQLGAWISVMPSTWSGLGHPSQKHVKIPLELHTVCCMGVDKPMSRPTITNPYIYILIYAYAYTNMKSEGIQGKTLPGYMYIHIHVYIYIYIRII